MTTSTEAAGGAPALAPAAFAAIAAILQHDARIHLAPGKTTLVQSRLARRLREHGLASFDAYLALVDRDTQERAAMVVALTTNHTHFFRENHHFDQFRRDVLPGLQAAARTRPVRLWSAGCSSGEEVYSLAMCMLGSDAAAAAWLRQGDVRLLATDLAPHVVAATSAGRYAATAASAIPEPYRRLWTRTEGNTLAIADAARDLVTARVLNLFGEWPMRRQFDVIFCRNVMIYFDDAAKAELEGRLVAALRPGGHLYIGHSERLSGAAAAAMTGCGHTIYRKTGGTA